MRVDTVTVFRFRCSVFRLLEIKLIHVLLGTIDPAISVDDLIVDESDLFVTGQSQVHSISDFLTVQYHYREFVHRITSDRRIPERDHSYGTARQILFDQGRNSGTDHDHFILETGLLYRQTAAGGIS